MMRSYVIALLTLTSTLFSCSALAYEPTETEKAQIEMRLDAMRAHMYKERKLEAARKELRDLERDKMLTRELERADAVPGDVIVLQRKITDRRMKANNSPIHEKKCRIETIEYDLDSPRPIEIRVASNSPAHITFFDFTGSVWPISAHAAGDTSSFTSGILSAAPHTYEINVNRAWAAASNNLFLEGLPAPIVIKLKGDEEDNFCVLNVKLPTSGPNAKWDAMSVSPNSIDGDMDDPVMMNVLRKDLIGLGAKERFITGVHDAGEAWIINERLYIRSRHWVESPPRAQMQDVSGIYVYRIDDPSQRTVWLRLPNGESAVVTISDYES